MTINLGTDTLHNKREEKKRGIERGRCWFRLDHDDSCSSRTDDPAIWCISSSSKLPVAHSELASINDTDGCHRVTHKTALYVALAKRAILWKKEKTTDKSATLYMANCLLRELPKSKRVLYKKYIEATTSVCIQREANYIQLYTFDRSTTTTAFFSLLRNKPENGRGNSSRAVQFGWCICKYIIYREKAKWHSKYYSSKRLRPFKSSPALGFVLYEQVLSCPASYSRGLNLFPLMCIHNLAI